MTLTDEELNIAICEWRGWKKVPRQRYWAKDEVRWTFDGKSMPLTSDLPSHITGPEALGNMHDCIAAQPFDFRLEFDGALRKRARERKTFVTMLEARDWAIIALELSGTIADKTV